MEKYIFASFPLEFKRGNTVDYTFGLLDLLFCTSLETVNIDWMVQHHKKNNKPERSYKIALGIRK